LQGSSPSAAPAQTPDIRIVVTGSNIKRVEGESALPVEIVTREDNKRTGATTISELLRYIPSVDAGVVNFITRKDFQGFEITGRYRISGQGDGEKGATLAAGFGNYEKDGYNVLFALDFFKRERFIARSATSRRRSMGAGSVWATGGVRLRRKATSSIRIPLSVFRGQRLQPEPETGKGQDVEHRYCRRRRSVLGHARLVADQLTDPITIPTTGAGIELAVVRP
jgi:outer membrane receptor protein involved in Fe transport